MVKPTLTVGGRAYVPPPPPNPNDPHLLLDRWHAALTRMLELAIGYGELDRLTKKRAAWCEANPWDDRFDERHNAMWATRRERNQRAGMLMDLAADMSRLQGQMPAGMINGLSALIGHPLWPYCGQRWAIAAAWMQTTDIFAIARQVYAELRTADEAGELLA